MNETYLETHFSLSAPVLDWPSEFAIITAYATTGETWSDLQNEIADKALEEELFKLGTLIGRVTGYSPSTGHAEPGWAVALLWEDSCNVGALYKQDAIYYVKGDTLTVSYSDARREPVEIGSFRSRVHLVE